MICINKIEIENFRSFKEKKYSKDLNELSKINIFTGKNNSGKTNTLRAVYLFFNPETYNPDLDMNFIKKITGGQSKFPKITIDFIDNEICGENIKYSIKCDLNKDIKSCYTINYKSNVNGNVKDKLNTPIKIKNYLNSKFKCVYLSTTDEVISEQANNALNDMILEYYKKRNTEIKNSITEFEEAYKKLFDTFENNIQDMESGMREAFSILNNNGFKVSPKLELDKSLKITDFLQKNLNLKIDDSYIQDINSKGAGIQRASIILMNVFLLNEIYSNKNKIILLDEPEAFLYPLLIGKVKEVLNSAVSKQENIQLFITTHSSTFLSDVNKDGYQYYNIEQKQEEREYNRSKNKTDINKYSIVSKYDRKIKNEVLRNYGLIDSIEDYEEVIIVEGQTDKNYIEHIFRNENIIPQIKYSNQFTYNYIGKGASSVLHILSYLDNINDVSRKVFVLLDGDEEGRSIQNKIKPREYKNLSIKCKVLEKDKVIEDYVFSKENLVKKVIEIESDFSRVENLEEKISNYPNVIEGLKAVIQMFSIDININKLKIELSKNLDKYEINNSWILDEMKEYFEI